MLSEGHRATTAPIYIDEHDTHDAKSNKPPGFLWFLARYALIRASMPNGPVSLTTIRDRRHVDRDPSTKTMRSTGRSCIRYATMDARGFVYILLIYCSCLVSLPYLPSAHAATRTITAVRMNSIRIIREAIHIGLNTHHQDQPTTPVNLRITNSSVNEVGAEVIFILISDPRTYRADNRQS